MTTETTLSPEVEQIGFINDSNGMARQRAVTFRVTGLDDRNPVVKLSAGELALIRVDALMVLPHKSYVQAYWDGDRKNPGIHFELWPEADSFEFTAMAWGVQYG